MLGIDVGARHTARVTIPRAEIPSRGFAQLHVPRKLHLSNSEYLSFSEKIKTHIQFFGAMRESWKKLVRKNSRNAVGKPEQNLQL